jgi:hypothetical protein
MQMPKAQAHTHFKSFRYLEAEDICECFLLRRISLAMYPPPLQRGAKLQSKLISRGTLMLACQSGWRIGALGKRATREDPCRKCALGSIDTRLKNWL